MKRRDFLSLLGGAVAAWPHGAMAQGWPQRVVRFIIPYVPGGGTDAVARLLAAGLSNSAGYQIIIENKGGGSTNIGTNYVAHAAPDGYTMLFCSLSFAINRFLFGTLGYDSVLDFAPVSLIASYPDLMAVPNASPAKTVAEFIAYAKSNGGKTTFASAGTGSSPHLAGELFKRRAGIEMTHIPYRGAGPAVTDVIAGRVDVIFNTFGSTLALVRDGQLRGLAVTSAMRFPAAPELPTVAEAALPGFDVSSWYALYAPAQSPPEIIRKLNADVIAVLSEPAIRDRIEQLGVIVIGSTPEELDRHLRAEIELWGPVIKAAGIKGE
jgi:tripartite-type tricarboxylate transporter receptor subunit TctC